VAEQERTREEVESQVARDGALARLPRLGDIASWNADEKVDELARSVQLASGVVAEPARLIRPAPARADLAAGSLADRRELVLFLVE